ncbi:MAG: hypothetical protein ACHQRM_13315 [Bacteroidia bacterium]
MKGFQSDKSYTFFLSVFLFLSTPHPGLSQDNYEIQVYESKLLEKGVTQVELHSNYAVNGLHDTIGGVLPTHHALHETIELTHGFTSWLEIGFYQFTAWNAGMTPAYVGNHIRPRITVPEKFKWPVGLSLSAEIGYQVPSYAADTWTLEIRPIIDKTIGRLYLSLNPVIDYSLSGLNHKSGAVFAPSFKCSWAFSSKVKAGLEYYNSMGPFSRFDEWNHQPHQLALAFDLDVSPIWEINIGYVRGLTSSVEQDLIKLIIGRKFGGKKRLAE